MIARVQDNRMECTPRGRYTMVKESYNHLVNGGLSLGVRPLWVTTLALVIGPNDYHPLVHKMASRPVNGSWAQSTKPIRSLETGINI